MQYETVIGLEIHVQLNTHSKVFCADDASFGAAPNTHVSAISLAHPGTLPRLNRAAIESAVRLGLALNSKINLISTFDRKNYFYADLPKGYQITQDRRPICVGGQADILYKENNTDQHRQVRIHHIHLEEDAGKSTHDLDPADSLIDLNRAGVPLLEIVTEPDIRSAEETAAFMEAIRHLVRWIGISDGNMEEGSLRCDVNVSVRPVGAEKLGQRCEIKNMNSMRFAKRAIEFEAARQIQLIENGGKVEQETRGFDPENGTTYPLREKEHAHDYRYFPEPDLPPVRISPERLDALRSEMPTLPQALMADFQDKYGLPEYDAQLLTQERELALYFLAMTETAPQKASPKGLANLLINKIKPWADSRHNKLAAVPVSNGQWATLIQLIESGQLSTSNAYQKLFPAMIEQPEADPAALARQLELIQSDDTELLAALADEVLARFPEKVNEYRKGKKGLIGFFMGELMRSAKGKADPKVSTQLLEERLKG